MVKGMRGVLGGIVAAALVALAAVGQAGGAGAELGLDVQGATVITSVSAGQTFRQTIGVTSSSPMNVQVEVDGLGQTLGGATTPLAAADDTSSFSARTFVSVDKTSLQLSPGVAQNIQATVFVPVGTSPGERYAVIYIHQIADSNATMVIANYVPVIITTPPFTPSYQGAITDLSVPKTYTGKPVKINTTFNDTGNCKITGGINSVTIADNAGHVVWQSGPTAIVSNSLIPGGFPRLITATYNIGLTTGTYTAKSDITLSNGTLLDTKTVSFQVVPMPSIPAAPVPVSPGGGTAPGPAIDSLLPTFTWNSAANADAYDLTLYRSPYTASDVLFDVGQLTGTSYSLPAGVLFGGEQYSWQVKASNAAGSSGSSQMFYFQGPGSSAPPAAATSDATGVTDTTATLNGNLTSLGNASGVSVSFEYGTTTSFGSTTSSQLMTSTGAFGGPLTGLSPATTYYFRAKAVGSSTVYGSQMSFTTLQSVAPGVTTGSATSITDTAATLNGSLTGLGSASGVAVSFEYGTTTSYGSATTSQTLTATGSFSATLSGLAASTTYHFHAKAAASSTVYGSDQSFTTNPAATTTPPPTTTSPPTTSLLPTTTAPPTTSAPQTSSTPTPSGPRSYKGYFPPNIDESSIVYQDFANQPFRLNAIDKAGTEVELSGAISRGWITIVAGRYLKEPQTQVSFSAGATKGGTGKPGIKFVGVRVEGVNQGTARVAVHYTNNEISSYDPASLFLAYFSGGSWHRCTNVSIEAGGVSGDIPVSRLSGAAIGLGGTLMKEAPIVPVSQSESNTQGGPGVSWAIVGVVIAPLLMIGIVAVVIRDRNRRKTVNERQ